MGYAVYEDREWDRRGRFSGYGVPAQCDQPGCEVEIDRGLAYRCGEEPGSERGCGLHFCTEHRGLGPRDDDPYLCERCRNNKQPFEPKPDIDEWVEHVLTDESWAKFRAENPTWRGFGRELAA